MKRKALLFFTASSLCGILAAPLGAQSISSPLQANIPFEFAVSGRTMPAGTYKVVGLPVAGLVQVCQANDPHESVYFNAIDSKTSAADAQPTLAFRRYGNQYFLAEISRGEGKLVLGLPVSRAERELAKTASSHPVQAVTLAAVRVGH
jgi:hypothetical protein